MPTIAQAAQGVVTALWGRALIRNADGTMRELKVGDRVERGDQILTTQDGIVQIDPDDGAGATTAARPQAAPAEGELEQVITGLNRGDAGTAPGAGLAGGGDGSLQEGLRVERIAENLAGGDGPGSGSQAVPRVEFPGGAAGATREATPSDGRPSITVDAPAVTRDTTPTITGTTNLPAGSTVTLVITDANGVQQTVLATAQPGGTYSVDVSSPLAEGNYTVVATATDEAGNFATANDAGAIDLTAPSVTVDAPALTNDATPTITGTTNLPAGSTVSLLVTDANGVQQTVLATVQPGGTYSADVPNALAEGSYTVVATATDAAGNAATANDAGAIDMTAPSITVDAPALTNDSTPTITGTTNLPAGSSVSLLVTDANGAQQTVQATVQPGGAYSVDVPSALAEGNYTVVATAVDAAGNAATANDSGAIDLTAPSVTVDAPALTNDLTPTIAGTTNLPAGSTIALVVTDANGASQTISATVQPGGAYSVDVPVALAEGSYTVVATATDTAGNAATANDSGVIDLTAPIVTVDAPALTNDSTPTITGTTNLPAGSTIGLLVTDANGVQQTVQATVQPGGTYAVDVPNALAEGSYTVVATATDAAGNAATANDSGAIDLTAPSVTVDAPALTGDSTPTITGTTNLPAGCTVSLLVTDANGVQQTVLATVQPGGSYFVDLPVALAEGNYTVVATATDAAGNSASANDAGVIDLSAPSITVDAPALTNDATPTITGTTNLPAGSTISLLVTDANGAQQTVFATVQPGGTYSVDVPVALAEGSYTVVATATDAAGNSATANDAGAIDLTAPNITVDAPALTNDATPTITGTTNLPAGSTVSLLVTDANGAQQTVLATVQPGGTYSVDMPVALAEGNYTVVATATDAAGNSASANDAGAIDLTAPSITVDAPALTNDTTPTITGTTNLPAGSTVSLLVTDANGAQQRVLATVQPGGTYSVDVPVALAEGNYTVVATATDAAGNSASANDAGAIDLTAPSITVDAPALTNDATPTITGTTNLPAGSTVSLLVTDANGVQQTVLATVQPGGSYSVDVPGALAEGNYTVVATATDAAGNSATDNDAGAIDLTAPSITVDAPALTNDATPTITGTTNLPAGSTVSLLVTDANGAQQTVLATVQPGGTYSVDVPVALAEGNYTVVATATDAAGNSASANDAGAIDLMAPSITVDAPALTNDATPTITGTTNLPAGSSVSLVVTDANGATQAISATVQPGGTYSVDVPAALAEGSYTVVATASDAAGNSATANDAGAIDLTAPSITVDAPALTNDATPTIAGTTNLPAGSTVSLLVTDAIGVQQTVLATVQPGGSYSVDVPSALAEGNYNVVATATDAAGNVATANDSGAIDLTAPSVTVDAPTLTNDSTPTITGTTNLPAGSTISLQVTDANGAQQTVLATVQPGGSYSVDVPSALAEGNYTVVATATDAAGNSAAANDAGAIDLTAPSITVAAPALTNDATPTITGTTNLPAGSTISLLVTDANGAQQTVQATVQPGGTYSVDVPVALAEGNYTVVATATDAAGNSATANDAGAIDLTAPSITVDAPALTNDATPTITGTTNLPAGSTVQLVVTDANGAQQTVLATVQAGGTYSVDVPVALAEGNYTVVATATDAAGNSATANDAGAIDLTAPSITVDAPALTNDATPAITGTTNLPAGSTVSLLVTDANGAQQTVLATVQPGGTYSVDVPVALAEGNYTVVATATDAVGNSATANDAGAIDLTAPSITVDAPALTNDSTPTITGTTNLPIGSTVSLLVTDANGVQQTALATVQPGGTYSVDVPNALAEGNYTVVATATDAAGNSATANDDGAIDLTAPSITVDAPALTNDATPTITGTTNLPAASTVSLLVIDAYGAQQTVLATVQPGGTFSVDVPVALAEGIYTVVATATDAAGNSATANDAGAIDLTAPNITVDAPALTNDATPAITGTTNLPAGSTVSLLVTDANGAQQTVLATVQPGGTYSVDVPVALAEGNYTVVATATDAAGNSASANDAGAIDLTAPSITVDAPALTNDATPTITGTTNLPTGSTISLLVTDANGSQQTVLATVRPGGSYSLDVPNALAEGNYTVVATATDPAGNAATANDSGAVDLTAPSVTVDAPTLTNDSTPTITGTTNLPAGSTISLQVTDANGAQQTVLATVQPGGSYSVDVPSALAEGNYTVVATATDAAGNSATANDAGAIDLTAPSITVDAPALTNDATPTITGTTNLPAGSTVSLLVTDANGVQQTVLATVQPGGTYSVDVPAALAEGNYTVVATATDAAGNSASANDAGAIDLTAPSITVEAPALTNDATPTITGTTNLPAGSTVQVVVTDAHGAHQTVLATVQPGGTYSVDVPGAMAEGSYTVVATATDAAGNSATANDAGAIDLTAPSITVDAPALTNDATPTITGTTNLPAGSTVSMLVTDAIGVQQTVLATVQPGGSYSVDVPNALAEGNYTVVATATDAAGNSATANDDGAIDLTAPSLTVDAPALTNDATPTIAGTANLPAGSTVSLLVTDAIGAQQTVLATVQVGGTYSVDVPVALAEGNYTVVATATDAAGNSATANDAGAIDLTAPSITVDAPALTNDATPTIAGTTNLPASSTVSLLVTDANGAQQTVLATVLPGGTYSVDVPVALEEGNYTVVATAIDAAGNSATANDAGGIDLTAPSITVDAPALTNDSTPTITGTTNLPAGSTVSIQVTDAGGAQQTVLATVQPGGTYSVDVPAALAEGNYTVVATATDAAGNSAAANDAGAIDLTAPSITVDAPGLTKDATPTITGTTNLPAGSMVSLLVTDANGVQQTVQATVQPGGSYSVDVPSALAEGNYTVVATATDAAGNAATANDSGAIDLTAPSVTVDAPTLTNDSTPTITGTTNLPAGSTVSLQVTDAGGAQQTVLATVQPGGTYSVDVPSALAEGNYTVVATATDAAGNSATANDAGAIDLTAPNITVDAPALTNDATPTITGSTNLPAGSSVTLVVTDSNGATQAISATVQPGGTYSVDVPAALAEGSYTVVATATDAAGNSATANDAGAIDLTAPSITVDAPALTNDATPTITGTTNLPAGSTINLLVTDASGAQQTVVATVQTGGTYSVDVPAALAEGNYTVVAAATDAAGNSATANDAGAIDLTAPSITVDTPALTNDSTPTIIGTTNLPAGSTVSLLVTDANGVQQTVLATVQPGGSYSVDVPNALAEGNYTVVATATDAAGNAATANDSGAIDLTAPSVTVDAPALTNDATPTITGTTNLPAGSTVSLLVTDANGAQQTVLATVQPGGSYSVHVPGALAEGNYSVVATATDAAGNSASANDVGAIDLTAPSITVDAPALTNDATPTITGTTNLPAGSTVSLLVTDANGAQQTVLATVQPGGSYSVDVPGALAEGNYTVVATATDAAGNSATDNDTGAIDLIAPNITVDAPALTNDATPTITGTTNLPAGSTISLLVTDANGGQQTVLATVQHGGTFSVDVPVALAEGNYTVVATATDAAGNSATANDAGAIDLTAPSITVDAPALTNDATPTITGTTNLPAGSTVSLLITDANGAQQTVFATVEPGGTYSVDVPVALAEGNYTVVATATDAAGNSASANDAGAIDLTAPSITVDAPALTNDATPTITGTTNLPAGSTVSLLVTDANGAQQTVLATVQAGGTYSVDVPLALAEGNYTVVATATDAAGNSATANDAGAIDLTAPSVMVDAPALTNDATPTITGTTNLPAGSTISLLVTDANGAQQTVLATVQPGGTYSVDVPVALGEGNYTVVATATDAAGNSVTANDAGAIDLTAPSITVDAPALTNDATPAITGTTNLPAGSTVSLLVTDANGAQQTVFATVQPGGTYSVEVPVALAEGSYTVAATATDAAGNSAIANDAGAIDLTAPSITVDAPALTNDATPTITGTTNLPAGSTVSLLVTDANGAQQTTLATVQPGGSYSVNVPNALAEGNYTVVATATDAAGNSATANDAGAIDLSAPSITVDAPALTNDATPTITGTTNLPAGSTVSLLVTDANGAQQTVLATVQPGGTFSVDVPAALAEGNYTVVATATDAAGNSATANDAGAIDLTAPSITADAPALTNDATPTITGTTNLPAGSTVSLLVTDANGAQQNVQATVQPGGTYSVDVPVALAEGNYTVVATATDAAGNSATANDAGAIDLTAPSITVDAPALTNDATPTITGTTNLLAGSTVSLLVTDANGVQQTVLATVQPGGTYSVDVPGAMAEGSYTVVATATDAAGNSATANDAGAIDLTAPNITVDAPALTNDATPTITGTTNLPAGSTVSLLVTDANGAQQSVLATVQPGGTYSVDVPVALAEGNYSVVATATDAAGNTTTTSDTGTLDFTAPVATLALDPVTADNVLGTGEAAGNVVLTGRAGGDAQPGDVVTLAINGQSFLATVGAGGAFSVVVPGSALAADADRRIDASITVTDAAGNSSTASATQDYTVNQAPTGTDRTVTTAEDNAYTFSAADFGYADANGQPLAAVRIDSLPGAGQLLLGNAPVSAGQVIAAADLANLRFVPAPDANGTGYASFTFSVGDGIDFDATPNRVTVDVTPVADPAVIGGVASGPAVEDAPGSVTGTLTVSDADAGEAAFQPQNAVAGAHGSFSIDAAGVWTYTLDNADPAVQALGQGQSLPSETFTVRSVDGTSTTVTVAITGTNDGPVAVADTRATNEDAAVSGNVLGNDSDVDAGTTLAVTQFVVNGSTYAAGATATLAGIGTLRIGADGAYTFTPAADYAGPVPVATYTVSDGLATATSTLTLTINPLNDTPVNTVGGPVTVLEDVRTALTGISVADPDESGSVANQKLATVQLSVSNGTLLVTLDPGTTISAGANGSATLTLSGTQASINATLASLGYQGSANYAGGDTLVVISRDGLGLTDSDTVAITVTPVNDAPSGTNASLTVTEDSSLALGRAAFGFVDAPGEGNNFLSVTVNPTSAGTLTLNGVTVSGPTVVTVGQLDAGLLRFTPAPNANGNAYATLSFQVRDDGGTANGGVDTDPTPNTLTFDVTAVNDAPVAQNDTSTAVEAGGVANGSAGTNPSGNVLTNDTDVDVGDTKAVTAVTGTAAGTLGGNTAGSYGTLTLRADGSYDYVLNNSLAAVQALRTAGDTLTDTFTYTMRDAAGLTSTATLTVTIRGSNDAPVATVDSASLNENASVTRNAATGVLANDSDVDSGDTRTVSGVAFGGTPGSVGSALNGTYGTLTLNADGSYSYDANRPAADALTAGQVVTETFNVTIRDTAGATATSTLSFTITGTNDVPTITGTSTGTVREDVTLSTGGTLTVVDADAGQSVFNAQSSNGTYGSFAINAVGVWTYTLNNTAANVQALTGSSVVTETFTVTTADGTSRNIVVTVNGTNDAPTAVADLRSTNEDTAVSGNVLGNDSDVDSASIAVTQFVVGGTTYAAGATANLAGVGTLSIGANGGYTFTPAANYAGAVPVATYTVSDGSASSTSTLALSITPVADAPTLNINGTTITGGTVTTPGLPASTGLTLQFYDNIGALSTANAGNIGSVESGVESSSATSTGTATDVSVASIGVDDAYRYTGYIYLQAGQGYTIAGYRDDTLMVKIGGTSVYAVGFNNWGNLTGSTFTPEVSGYYSLEVIAYNGDGVGSLDLSMSVNGAPAVDLNTTNFNLYRDTSTFGGTVVGSLVSNGDGGYYPTNATGPEDGSIALGNIGATLNDTDGSETLALRIGNIPVGATLSDGTNTFVASAGTTSVDITGWTLSTLRLTPPSNLSGTINLSVTATSTDSNGSTATSSGSLPVTVRAVADAPAIMGQTVLVSVTQGNASTPTLALPVLATLLDVDGSETLSVTIAGLPSGATLNHGSADASGTWTVGAADLADLSLTLPAGYTSTGTTLTVNAIATEGSNGSTASTSTTVTLLADYTTATPASSTGNDTITGSNTRADYIDAQAGNDSIDGRAGSDLIRGGAGNDTIQGGTGNDLLFGDAGNDSIVGGAGSDRIHGGAGNDTLTGSATPGTADLTSDVFAWTLADAGAKGTPATDTITDFSAAAVSAGGDVLDLRDLLAGDALGAGNTAGNLANFLDFSVSTSGGVTSTTIHISSSGGFAGGGYLPGQEDQAIVLQGVNLPTALGLASGASDDQIIQELLTRGKLIVDS